MTKRSRYLLLVLGFVIFLILAPLIILYVRGVSFNFATGSFVPTGILAVRSQPTGVKIFLNNKLERTGSGDVKFIAPGDYKISISKDAYNTWSKRLSVLPGQVTWASPTNNYIYLFYKNPKVEQLSSGVLDFYSQGDRLVILHPDSLIETSLNKSAQQDTHTLPKPVDKIIAHDNAGTSLILSEAQDTQNPTLLFFSSAEAGFSDLSSLFASLPKFQFAGNGDLYALSDNILYKVDALKKTKTPVLSGIKAFYFLNNSLYFIQINAGSQSLLTGQAPFLDNQVLLSNLPTFSQGSLLVTYAKQIFLLADGSLYIGSSPGMQKVADNAKVSDFYPESSALSVQSGAEFDYYDTGSQGLRFVTRSGEPILNPVINTSIGWAFFLKNNGLSAIELDSRDTQNQYDLYTGKAPQKFSIDDAGQKIILLDNGELESLAIR